MYCLCREYGLVHRSLAKLIIGICYWRSSTRNNECLYKGPHNYWVYGVQDNTLDNMRTCDVCEFDWSLRVVRSRRRANLVCTFIRVCCVCVSEREIMNNGNRQSMWRCDRIDRQTPTAQTPFKCLFVQNWHFRSGKWQYFLGKWWPKAMDCYY